MGILNYFQLAIAWIIFLSLFVRLMRRQEFGMLLGLSTGICLLVLVPFSIVAIYGNLEADAKTHFPTVDWEADAFTLAKALLVINTVGLSLGFAAISGMQAWPDRITSRLQLRIPRLPLLNTWHLFLMYVIGAAFILVRSGLASGQSHWARSRGEWMMREGIETVAVVQSFVGGLRLSILILVASRILAGATPVWHGLLMLSLVGAVDLYTTGNRIFLLQAAVLTALAMLSRGHRRWILICILASIPFGYAMFLWSAIRSRVHRWSEPGLIGAWQAFQDSVLWAHKNFGEGLSVKTFIAGISESASLNALVMIIHGMVPDRGYLYGQSLVRWLTFPIPRSWWLEKPRSITSMIGGYAMPSSDEFSAGASLIGEMYLNFGMFGGVLVLIILFAYTLIVKVLITDRLLAAITLFLFGFAIVRFPVGDYFIQVLFLVPLLWLVRIPWQADDSEKLLPVQEHRTAGEQ